MPVRLVVGRTAAPECFRPQWCAGVLWWLCGFDCDHSSVVEGWVADHDEVGLHVGGDADDGFECSLVSGVESFEWDLGVLVVEVVGDFFIEC